MRGKTMNIKSTVLMVLLWFAIVTLLPPNAAGFEEMTGTDTSGQWTVHVRAEEGVCGQDRNGFNIQCTKFDYEITKNPAGSFPNQANVKIPICPPGSGFSIVDPTDRSVKIRDCDPNSGFVCDDLFADAITWDSLKDIPNVQTDFSVAVTPASIEETTLALVTEFGNILVPTLGPGCCSEVQRISEVTYTLPSSGWSFCGGSVGSVRASFNACSGDQTGDVIDPHTDVPYTEIPGGYFCTGDLVSYDKRTCTKGKKFGPVTGALFYTNSSVYFGWGSRIYKGPCVTTAPAPVNPSCDTASATGYAPFPRIRTYAGVIALEQDACGNLLSGKHLVTGEVVFPEAAYSWFCEATANGRNSGVCSRIVTSNIDDAIGDGTCRIWSGGRWLYFAGSCP